LDIKRNNGDVVPTDYLKKYAGGSTPEAALTSDFDNFIVDFTKNNPINNAHISFQKRNGDWLANELEEDDNLIEDCSAFCSNAGISGNSRLCNSSTYSVTSEATWVFWWVSQGAGAVTTSTNGNQITLTLNNSAANTTVVLNATYGNTKCGYATVTKDVWVGKPNVPTPGISGGYDNASTKSKTQLSVSSAVGNTHYYWSVTPYTTCSAGPGPTINSSNQNVSNSTSRYAIIDWGNCAGRYSVVCYAKNECGGKYIGQKWVTVYDPYDGDSEDPCDDAWRLKSYPNPIKSGSIVVNKYPPGDPCDDDLVDNARKSIIENVVKIYDFYGNVVYKNSFKSNEFNIKGLKLRRGHYILNVQSSDGQNLRKIITME